MNWLLIVLFAWYDAPNASPWVLHVPVVPWDDVKVEVRH